MKKLLVLLTMGFAIIAEPFLVQFKALHSEALIAHAVDETTAVKTREVDPSIFDYNSYTIFDNLPYWTPDQFSASHDEPEGSIEQLNSTANYDHYLVTDGAMDILSSFIEEGVDYTLNDERNLVFLKLNEQKYCSFFYQHVTPIIYFDSSLSGEKNISIYLDIGWIREDFDNLKIRFPELKGALPLFIINDEYSFLKVEFNDTGWKLITDHFARIEPCKRDSLNTHQDIDLMMKITIPYLDAITDIKYFHSVSCTSVEEAKNYSPNSTITFAFDASLRNQYYFYFFDIVSLSVLRKEMIIDNADYSFSGKAPSNIEVDPYQKMVQVVSMKVLFTGTRKEKNVIVSKEQKNIPFSYTTILPKEIEFTFLPDAGYTDGEGNQYLYFNDFNLEENVSGEFKILSVTFHPYYYNPSTNQFEMRTAIFTQHYEKANVHKYSFNIEKSTRIYYYKMSSYYRYYTQNGEWYDYIYGWLINMTSNYHCFGFSFYFDKARRNPIPNVKKLTFKYQCGYDKPNPEEGSNGFYPNGSDESKNIKVRTMEVVENKVRRLGALDNEGMCLTNNATKKMMTDDNGITYDYVLYKWRERGTGPGITTMDALEITYETAPGEMVRMVGNSKGLHVVVDEDGIARVYNSEGNLEDDYGVYESNDGTLVPGKDENGDGKIDSDEVINSDTGIKNYVPYVDDSNGITRFIDKLTDFFQNKAARVTSIIIGLAVIIALIIFVPKLGKRKKH